MKCGFCSEISDASWVWTKATCAVICCELELLGEEATELVGKMVDTVIGASSDESAWSIGTTSMIETPSDVVPVCKIYFFWNRNRYLAELCEILAAKLCALAQHQWTEWFVWFIIYCRTCVCVCMIWMGALFVSDGEIWFVSVMVTMSPFVVAVAVAAVTAAAVVAIAADVDWFVCVVVDVIWLLGVIVTKFRCNANWAAMPPPLLLLLLLPFSLCRTATRFINLFLVFVSVFLAWNGFSQR